MGIHHSPSKTAASTTVRPSLPHPLSHPTHSHPTLQISRPTTTPPHLPGPRTPCTPPTPYSSRTPTRDYRTSRAATRRPSHETDTHSSADRIHSMRPRPPHTQYRSRTALYRYARPNRISPPPTNHTPLVPGGSEFFDAVRLVVASPRFGVVCVRYFE